MPGIATARTRRPYQRPPGGPFALNRDSPQARGLVAWWPLGENNPAGYADYASGKWQLTQAGAITPAGVPGFGGLAASNTASTANYLTNAASVLTAVPLTLSAWFLPRTTAEYGATSILLALGDNAASSSYYALLYDGSNSYARGAHTAFLDRQGSTSATWASSTAVAAAGTPGLFTAVCPTAGSASVYLNAAGKQTDAVSTRTPASWVRTSVGCLRSSTTTFSPLSGLLWDARVYNVALTDDEVAAMYDPRTQHDLYYPLGRKTFSYAAAAAASDTLAAQCWT